MKRHSDRGTGFKDIKNKSEKREFSYMLKHLASISIHFVTFSTVTGITIMADKVIQCISPIYHTAL